MSSATANVLRDCLIVLSGENPDSFGENQEFEVNPPHIFLKEGGQITIDYMTSREDSPLPDTCSFIYYPPDYDVDNGDGGQCSPEMFYIEDLQELAEMGYIEISGISEND